MNDIDGMDMIGFFKVRAWETNRANAAKVPKRRFIDDVWPVDPALDAVRS